MLTIHDIQTYKDIPIGDDIRMGVHTLRLCRHPHRNGGYGVWSETHKQWLFGGIEMNRKSLRCAQHWLLRLMLKPDYTEVNCEHCGAPVEVELLTGYADGDVERYVAECRVCGYNNSFEVDHRLPITDEEMLDVLDEDA